MGNRRKARELALQMLFYIEFSQRDENSMATFWNFHPAPDAVRNFATQLVEGVIQNKSIIDQLIEKYALNWTLDRMTVIDRNILRMAVNEMTLMENIPLKVTMDEAIEIGRRYGDGNSSAFINGILDRIIKDQSLTLSEKREN